MLAGFVLIVTTDSMLVMALGLALLLAGLCRLAVGVMEKP